MPTREAAIERYAIAMVTLIFGAVLALTAYALEGGARTGSGAMVDEFRRGTVERLAGRELTFVPGSPPVGMIAEGDALAAARRNLIAEAESEPVLTYGRLTDPFSRNGPPTALVENRPVWVASYPRVRMIVRGTPRGGPKRDTVPATADVVIDARTGAFLRSMHDGLEPVAPMPSATWDCIKLTC
jgi:hypothetical protein